VEASSTAGRSSTPLKSPTARPITPTHSSLSVRAAAASAWQRRALGQPQRTAALARSMRQGGCDSCSPWPAADVYGWDAAHSLLTETASATVLRQVLLALQTSRGLCGHAPAAPAAAPRAARGAGSAGRHMEKDAAQDSTLPGAAPKHAAIPSFFSAVRTTQSFPAVIARAIQAQSTYPPLSY